MPTTELEPIKAPNKKSVPSEPPVNPTRAKIGMTVQYIQAGDLRNKPKAAVILDIFATAGREIVQIKMWGVDQDITLPFAIRHIDDPYNQDHQDALKANGAWREVQ